MPQTTACDFGRADPRALQWRSGQSATCCSDLDQQRPGNKGPAGGSVGHGVNAPKPGSSVPGQVGQAALCPQGQGEAATRMTLGGEGWPEDLEGGGREQRGQLSPNRVC